MTKARAVWAVDQVSLGWNPAKNKHPSPYWNKQIILNKYLGRQKRQRGITLYLFYTQYGFLLKNTIWEGRVTLQWRDLSEIKKHRHHCEKSSVMHPWCDIGKPSLNTFQSNNEKNPNQIPTKGCDLQNTWLVTYSQNCHGQTQTRKT